MTSTKQLWQWCDGHRVPFFKGVFCADNKPNLRNYENARVIFNWSPCSGGTHWLAFLKQGNVGWWFDSYGLEPGSDVEKHVLGGDPGFKRWIESQVSTWHFNSIDLQGLTSDVCGQYSCWAVKNSLPNQNPRAWDWVSTDQNHNDAIIQQLVRIPGFRAPLR